MQKMIKGLQGITGITVSGGAPSVPYINQNINNPVSGMIRVWGSDMQVFDGNSWLNMGSSYATVGLDQDVLDIIQWARKQRDQQLARERRIKNNPALKKAYEAIQRAEENYDILDKIVGEDGNIKQS